MAISNLKLIRVFAVLPDAERQRWQRQLGAVELDEEFYKAINEDSLPKSPNRLARNFSGQAHALGKHQCMPKSTALDRLKMARQAERDDANSRLSSHDIDEILACHDDLHRCAKD